MAAFWDERVEAGRTWQRHLIQPPVERLLGLESGELPMATDFVIRDWRLDPYDGDQAPTHIHHAGEEASSASRATFQ